MPNLLNIDAMINLDYSYISRNFHRKSTNFSQAQIETLDSLVIKEQKKINKY